MEIFKLKPVLKSHIWGGKKLAESYGKTGAGIISESWELSCHPSGLSIIENGEYAGKTLRSVISGANFPVLIKLIDSAEDLSIQVHPGGEAGKAELWHILECAPGAFIYYGFNKELTKNELLYHINNNSLTGILNKIYVNPGDVFFVAPGTVHAIGRGITLAEIQQNSDITYRVYDYGRPRELHVEKALEVMRLVPADNNIAAAREYFNVKKLEIDYEEIITIESASFASLLFVDGKGSISGNNQILSFSKGDSFFVPPGMGEIRIFGECKVLVTMA